MATVARRSPAFGLALAGALALLALASCKPGGDAAQGTASGASGRTAPGLRAVVEVKAAAVGGGVVEVTVRDGDAPVSGATVAVQGDMTHAGMAPVIADAPEAEPGLYRTGEFAFSMAGDWVVTAEVETADGRSATAETFVTVAR